MGFVMRVELIVLIVLIVPSVVMMYSRRILPVLSIESIERNLSRYISIQQRKNSFRRCPYTYERRFICLYGWHKNFYVKSEA